MIGGSEDGMVYFWDLVDAKVVSKFRAHDLVVNYHTLFFSFVFNFLSIVMIVISIVIQVTSVSYHPKEDCMLTSSVDGTVRVWKK